MPAASELAKTLASGSEAEQIEAAEKLAHLGEDAQPAAVALVKSLESEDDALRDWVVAALEGLGPPAASDAAELAALTSADGVDEAYWAVTLLGRLGTGGAAATTNLIQALESHPDSVVRERAAWALGKIGPPAAAAKGALDKAAASCDARLAKLAREAIGLIGGSI